MHLDHVLKCIVLRLFRPRGEVHLPIPGFDVAKWNLQQIR